MDHALPALLLVFDVWGKDTSATTEVLPLGLPQIVDLLKLASFRELRVTSSCGNHRSAMCKAASICITASRPRQRFNMLWTQTAHNCWCLKLQRTSTGCPTTGPRPTFPTETAPSS